MSPVSRMTLGLFFLLPILLTGVLAQNLHRVLSGSAPRAASAPRDGWQNNEQAIRDILAEQGVVAREARFWKTLTETPND